MMVDATDEIQKTVRVSGAIAKASTFGGLRALAYLTVPLLELVIIAGVVYGIVALPARLMGLGSDE